MEAHQQYTELLAATGREDEALRSARRAVALDPTSAIRLIELGLVLYLNGRNAEAVLQLELAIVRDPELAPAYTTLALARMGLGEVDEAERLWREEYIPRLDLGEAARIDWDQTLAARFEAIRNQDSKAYARCCAEFNVALDWLMVGDTARAIRTISEAVLQSARFDARLFYSLWLPGLDGIRNDPRFQEALSEALELAGLSGATLRRAQGTE